MMTCLLLVSHTMEQRRRYKYGTDFLKLTGFFLICLVCYKFMLKDTANKEDYRDKIKYMKSLGFSILDPKKRHEAASKIEINLWESYQNELVFGIILLAIGFYFMKMKQLLGKLSHPDQRENLEDFVRLSIQKSQAETEKSKVSIGTKDVLTKRQRLDKHEQDLKDSIQLQQLQKVVRKNFVGSLWYFSLSRYFYIGTLLILVFHAMSKNSSADIPTLFLILVQSSFYATRRSNATLYLTLSCIIVYFIQLILLLKIIFDISSQVEYLNINESRFAWIKKQLVHHHHEFRLDFHLSLFLEFFLVQAWKTTLWQAVRETTGRQEYFWKDLGAYFKIKQIPNFEIVKNKISLKKEIKGKQKMVSQKESNFPVVLLWSSRVSVFFMSYMYHTDISFINLVWIIFTFLFSVKVTFFASILVMLPVLSWEFFLIYAVRVPSLQDLWIIQEYGSNFEWTMKKPVFEQAAIFMTVAQFFMMIGTIQLSDRHENRLIKFFKNNVNGSNTWKFVFFFVRHIQSVTLLTLFLIGIADFNNLQNLGFMIFFVIYTAYEEVYRRTSKLLILFIGFFILGNYYISLNYPVLLEAGADTAMFKWFSWLNLVTNDDINDPFGMCQPQDGKMCVDTDMYFRLKPVYLNWFILISMSLLMDVNKMYAYKQEVAQLTEQCVSSLRDQYAKSMEYFVSVKNLVEELLIYLVLLSMIALHSFLQTSLINWVLFVLNTMNLAFIIRGYSSLRQINQQLIIANMIKLFALVVLVADIFFVSFFGFEAKEGQTDSLDYWLKQTYPGFYKNLGIIGFRSNEFITKDGEFTMKYRLLAYVAYFLFAIYLVSYFKNQKALAQGESEFSEEYYKRLLQFQTKNVVQSSLDLSNGVFKKQQSYSMQDFIDFYDKIKFTMAFQVYRRIDWWPYLDALATYGHLVNNFLIVYNAINISVNAITCFNLFCVCLFYGRSTRQLNLKSQANFRQSGLQSQCDLKLAGLITKRYKKESFRQFLQLREKIWKIQFFALVFVICLGYPFEILASLRERFEHEKGSEERLEIVDTISFYAFLCGLYKDGRKGMKKFYTLTFMILLIGLVVERQAINWLKNRFGCSHFKLQKMIELDTRREAIRNHWEVCPPTYETERYRAHYFHHDFDELKKKFESQDRDEEEDFVPYKVALRLKKTVTFSVKLDGRAPYTIVTEKEKEGLLQGKLDYEDIQILREFKIKALENNLRQAVDRKYGISFLKGMQIFFECLMILLLMVSLIMKANLFSLVYLIFIFRFAFTSSKTQLLVRLNTYMSVSLLLQYLLYTLNLNSNTSPAPFPPGFEGYPAHKSTTDYSIQYAIPVFFHYYTFHDLRICYLLGIGVDKNQVQNLLLDFLNIYLVSMYILTFRNPVLRKVVHKVFWQFPSQDNSEQFSRLDKKVQKQVKWLHDPHPLSDERFAHLEKQENKLSKQEKEAAPYQFQFGSMYHEQDLDLNYTLKTYVDLSRDEIWSEDTLKEVKWEFKENSQYFRIVKQGSVLVYLTFHILTIFLVLLMATVRQSVLSLGYVAILFPRLKDGSEVLDQRSIFQSRAKEQLEEEVQELLKQLVEMKRKEDADEVALQEIQQKYDSKLHQLEKMNKKAKLRSFRQQLDDKKKQSQKQWMMVATIKGLLMYYCLFDFTLQILAQMPLWETNQIRQIYVPETNPDELYSYDHYLETLRAGHAEQGLEFVWKNFWIQVLGSVIIMIIMLQNDIFQSYGYLKFVTQTDGSMDLLVQLSTLKAKSITYQFNNFKIRQILSIQRRKENIMSTVEKLKEKIVKWRQFTKLDNDTQQRQGQSTTAAQKRMSIVNRDGFDFGKGVTFHHHSDSETKVHKISKQDREDILERLTQELVEVKKMKLSLPTRIYLWLNKTFTEQLLFKNKRMELEGLKQKLAEGEVHIPTELETIMYKEAKQIIRHQYGHLQGSQQLLKLLQKKKQTGTKSLLKLTNLEKKVKWQQMQVTSNFIQYWAMAIHLVETFFYIVISSTQNMIYASMVYSMWQNAGLISLPYPIAVFGYALLEETRPRQYFWTLIRQYTTFILVLKLVFSLVSGYNSVQTVASTFKFWTSLLKLGLIDHSDSIQETIFYLLPEVLIICLIMLNQVKLKLLGLFYVIEADLETIGQGILRNLEHGNEEAVKQKEIESANMYLYSFFWSKEDQIETERQYMSTMKEHFRMQIDEMTQEELEDEYDTRDREECLQIEMDNQDKRSLEEKQEELLDATARGIWKTTKEFDLDTTQKYSPFDKLIQEGVLHKSLEHDSLIYVEGSLTKMQALEDETWDVLSAGDFEEDLQKKSKYRDEKKKEKEGTFERSSYFQRIFPQLKIQKPGYDLYGSTTSVLAFIAFFVFFFYKDFTVDPSVFKFISNQSSIFKGDMAVTLLIVITIIIVERYANRTDTKAVHEEPDYGHKSSKSNHNNDMFHRNQTLRSMTTKIRTIQTVDLDMKQDSVLEYLKSMNQEEGLGAVDGSKTKITSQQKTKYILHWAILLVGHIYIFWFIPIRGNYQLYGQPECNYEKIEYYGCMNFHENSYLRFFYILILLYLVLSSLQLSFGFPIMKKPSSVLQYYNDLAKLGADIYISIPFAVEIRCLLDFTMSKTSLDMFQYYQLFNYHYEIYAAKVGNKYYYDRKLGERTSKFEKCINGVLISSILMFFLVGPFILFSEYGGMVATNPVISADVGISFEISKAVYTDSDGLVIQSSNQSHDSIEYATTPYLLFENKNPFFRQVTPEMWKKMNQSQWTETRHFSYDQVQDIQLNAYSDTKWGISSENLKQLKREVEQAVSTGNQSNKVNISLSINYDLTREQPPQAKTASLATIRELNLSFYDDCITGKQILKWTDAECQDTHEGHPIVFRQALNPNLVLGQSDKINQVVREGEVQENMMHDIRLVYKCDNTWEIYAKREPTQYSEEQRKEMEVDPETCLPLDSEKSEQSVEDFLKVEDERTKKEWEQNGWERFKITVFSMLVSSSFLAAYNPSTFYTSIVLLMARIVRPAFIFGSWKGWIYEATKTDQIIKLIEACYMKRHEEDLIGEEEIYHMLLEIMRSPELFRVLTGSALKGSIEPSMDKLRESDKQKLINLNRLEQKGFDVGPLKEKLLRRAAAE